ncbi:MAG: hypothetical protein INQ03_07680 [Candidatus Heimdallarchaeota archaeon]|nr:hypothetical protein [Candidatus Heimdallarchaeota archaeon]
MKTVSIGIECLSCTKQWRLDITTSNNKVDAFATLCECGEIIVGNINNHVDENGSIQERFLTNASYQIISIDMEKIRKLPVLELE